MILNEEQKNDLILYLKNFMKNQTIINDGIEEDYHTFDEKRISSIPKLRDLVDSFLKELISLKEFKERSELECRKFPYWGFKNFSGQMQLNQYANNINDSQKEELLRTAITVPADENEACNKIDSLAEYLSKLKEKTDNPKSIPRVSQYYLLSYFWEIQDYSKWPVYYGSTKKVLLSLGVRLDTLESYGKEYLEFLKVMNEIRKLYEAEGHKEEKFPYWFIEHVLWHQFIKLGTQIQDLPVQDGKKVKSRIVPGSMGEWIPDIVKDLNELSLNKDTEWSKRMGLKPEKAFETKLRYGFTLLGYETKELGQGTGREPDGIALSIGVHDGDYAIVYDAKARENGFSIGTGDREVYEYIQKKREELRRHRINKTYFVIVSSEFNEAANIGSIREIYRKTQVPVILLKAIDLLFIIDTKLQNVEIDHARLEYLFLDTGLISREKIIDILGIR